MKIQEKQETILFNETKILSQSEFYYTVFY